MHIVNDHMVNILQSNATTSSYMNISSSAIYGLIVVNNELVFKLDHHACLEDDPEGLILDHGVAEGAGGGVSGVAVGGVGHDVVTAALSAGGSTAKADGAVGQTLAVGGPIGIAAPAVVDGVSGEALGYAGGCWRGEEVAPS